jgi:predicted AAA+ superfamily ATPase
MYRRFLEASLLESLANTPVTLLTGARQTGKTTLV